jgi:anti-sigma regulatory factor (Ser/Thr protein kinase)
MPVSASAARRFLAATCARWQLDELRDDPLLAVSELVTNSVVHARTPIVVNVTVVAGVVEVGVRDHDMRLPRQRAERPDLLGDLDALTEHLPSFEEPDPRHSSLWIGDGCVTAGRGLHLLSAVSDEWGVNSSDDDQPGKEVWFTHAVPDAWAYAAECECGPTGSIVTASGCTLAIWRTGESKDRLDERVHG